jgi:hypothetical protein
MWCPTFIWRHDIGLYLRNSRWWWTPLPPLAQPPCGIMWWNCVLVQCHAPHYYIHFFIALGIGPCEAIKTRKGTLGIENKNQLEFWTPTIMVVTMVVHYCRHCYFVVAWIRQWWWLKTRSTHLATINNGIPSNLPKSCHNIYVNVLSLCKCALNIKTSKNEIIKPHHENKPLKH